MDVDRDARAVTTHYLSARRVRARHQHTSAPSPVQRRADVAVALPDAQIDPGRSRVRRFDDRVLFENPPIVEVFEC